ncbi:MAG: FKBP-type peptidyl-prolyl cis-trans isomerase [Gammaproteobacteria bacterium]|nr:FKBP-type peptidyl-prolyl cis-trans isomerase [Gammaproteobacteria bacterium]
MKITKLLAVMCLGAVPMGAALADVNLKDENAQIGYAVGVRIGMDMKERGIGVDSKALAAAIEDVLKGNKLKMSDEELGKAMQALQRKQMERATELSMKNLEKGQKFLAQNKTRKGVKTLESGVQYEVITAGKGASPTEKDSVIAHYRGTSVDGTVFDSSYDRGQPATFPVNGVIKGWQEILPKMKVGDKWKVYIPADSAYGEHGAGGAIGPNEALIFEIELLEVKK